MACMYRTDKIALMYILCSNASRALSHTHRRVNLETNAHEKKNHNVAHLLVHSLHQGAPPHLVVPFHSCTTTCHFHRLLLTCICGPPFHKLLPCCLWAVVVSLCRPMPLPVRFPHSSGCPQMPAQVLVYALWVNWRVVFVLLINFIVHRVFLEYGVFFPALLSKVEELVRHLLRRCVPCALQIVLALRNAECHWLPSCQ